LRPLLQAQAQTPAQHGSVPFEGVICQCTDICPKCHLLRQPPQTQHSMSSAMNTIGFTEMPHIVDVHNAQADPRSPIRRGTTRIPAQVSL
jgi:hypothetical protein